MKEKGFKIIGAICIIVSIVLAVNTSSEINKFYGALYTQTENISLIEKLHDNNADSKLKSNLESEIEYKNYMFKQINPPPAIDSKIYLIYFSFFLFAIGLIPFKIRSGDNS
ncbi:MAG: hypothetical protein HRT58_10020 [Crocinitomicaceae bacterium]|nr:hypothetical protein [Flavobacteriales bacterium]NQZ35990.1 hypothetical protein [Crocinitomicaceae bacterium]